MSDARERILQSAITIFSEYGFAGASTREIASKANVHQPAIAYHFKSKEQLWKEAVSSMWNTFLDELTAEMNQWPELSLEKRIEVFTNFYVRHLAKTPASVMLVVQDGAQSDSRGQWFNTTWISPMARVMFENLTGRKWQTDNKQFNIEAVSLLSILTGATLIFSQRSQLNTMLDLDTCGTGFVEKHVDTVTRSLKALLLNL